mmetsp:Transcript_5983/g.5394  ORF Transcript_5983/g.5394 Transcript_5983/m.5394 type:complete len:96 (+) Transcript_5983:418-705(+)
MHNQRDTVFFDLTPLNLEILIKLNIIPQVLYTKYMDQRSQGKREFSQKPTLIHMSSLSAEFPVYPKNGDYSSSKWFNKKFGLAHGRHSVVDDLII